MWCPKCGESMVKIVGKVTKEFGNKPFWQCKKCGYKEE